MSSSVKSYAAKAFGYVRTKGSLVSVLAPLPKLQMELFAELKQNDRSKALNKVENAILWTQLNAHDRNLVFKSTNAAELESREERPTFGLELGNKVKQVAFEPRKYLGPPSKQDLRVLATTSHTAEEVHEAVPYIQQCLKTKELGKNFDPELGQYILKRAAKAGIFQSMFHELTTNSLTFKPLLRQDFHSEALRIYALRIPYLSKRSKSMLSKLHSRSNPGIARELTYAYGLTEYKAKFGEEHMGRLPETIEAIKSLLPAVRERPRASMKKISQVDLVLGRTAMLKCGLPEAKEVVSAIEEVMTNTARNRPLTEALAVDMADRDLDGVSEYENEAETSEEPASQ